MNAEHAFAEQEVLLSPVEKQPVTWQVNTELSNIISLAEQGLLRQPKPEDNIEQDFGYGTYSALNEW